MKKRNASLNYVSSASIFGTLITQIYSNLNDGDKVVKHKCSCFLGWRLEEMEKIDRSLTGAERKAALCQLLDQETQLIASIGRHKQDADVEMKQKTIQSFLDKVGFHIIVTYIYLAF